jgi:hypothetical protein
MASGSVPISKPSRLRLGAVRQNYLAGRIDDTYGKVIGLLNSIIRRRANYHRHVANGHVELGAVGSAQRFPGVLLDIEARRTAEAQRDRMSEQGK